MAENEKIMENRKTNRPFGGGGPGGHIAVSKPKDFKQSIKKLIKYMRPFYIPLLIAIVFAVGGTILNILGPKYLGDLTNYIQDGLLSPTGEIDMDSIISIGIMLGIMYSVACILLYLQSFITTTVTQLVTKKMRSQLSKKVAKIPLNYFDTNSLGDVLSRMTNDVDTVGQSLSMSISSLLTAVVLLVGVTIMMFTVNPIMALTAVGASIIGFVFMAVIMSKSRKYYKGMQTHLGTLNGQIEETYSSLNVIKVYNGGKKTVRDFTETNTKLLKASQKANFMTGFMPPLMSFVGNFGYVAVCIVGSILVLENGLGIGVIASFMIYIRLFTQPLSSLAQVGQSMQSVTAASERVFEFLEEKEQEDESHKTKHIDTVKGDIEFKNVKFGYNENRTIINDFTAKIKAGSKVAIVGPTGAGKTTIVNLLMRFYEINSGDILIDGVNVKDLTRENVHKLFGMVLQDTWMFEGTIRENIIYSKENVTDEQLDKVCKATNIDHFIHSLPKGYDTIMDDKATLSAGQKQLVTIARAMVDDAPMLILDEATSSVDTRTEVLIQKAMDALTESRTTFVIAHRLSTIKNADMILVLKDGDIIENGNHEELLAKNGFYAELYNSQFSE